VFFCGLEVAYADLPYGTSSEDWDFLPSREFYAEVVATMVKMNLRQSWVIILWHNHYHAHIVRDVLEGAGFQEVTPIFWSKPGTVRYGGLDSHSRCVETGTIARIGAKSEITFNTYPGEPTRPNICTHKAVTSRWRYAGGKKNSCEKPVELAAHWMGLYGTQGSTVLVVCAGTGSEVMAAISLKRNVVAVEKDPLQWKAIQERIAAHQLKVARKEPRGEEKKEDAAKDKKDDAAKEVPQSQDAPLPTCSTCKEPADVNLIEPCEECSALVHCLVTESAAPCRFVCVQCDGRIFCREACHMKKVGVHPAGEPQLAETAPAPDTQVKSPFIISFFCILLTFYFAHSVCGAR